MQLHTLFRERREALGLTQEEVGVAVRKSRRWVSKVESGWTGIATVDAMLIASALKIPVHELAKALRKAVSR